VDNKEKKAWTAAREGEERGEEAWTWTKAMYTVAAAAAAL
jgi:hypothetical protein